MSYVRIVTAREKLNEHVRQLWKNSDLTVFSVLECHYVLELSAGKYLSKFEKSVYYTFQQRQSI